MLRDEIFKNGALGKGVRFEFTERVAGVFDDMICRSIPAYNELQQILVDLIRRCSTSRPTIYDIGCSTGETIERIVLSLPEARVIGVDSSEPMIDRARHRLYPTFEARVQLICDKAQNTIELHKNSADVVVMSLVLQFMSPEDRPKILCAVYQCLRPGGVLLLVEKVLQEDATFEFLMSDCYADYKKRQGYSSDEIENKKAALAGVLVPLRQSENAALLSEAGFSERSTFYSMLCFHGLLARKAGELK
ncbi:methyltransferase domain-containing protein [Aestuariivirga sp.]|uniref:methyltransferase domain-containing protein n=1 Tax=Aestuariivirga sp. TaxID=2650926 RepID=UPI003BAA3E96